jgi:hypothetical protein
VDDGQNAHAKDYCALLLGNNIPLGVGYCLLYLIRSFHNLRRVTNDITHAFLWYIFNPYAYENDSIFQMLRGIGYLFSLYRMYGVS